MQKKEFKIYLANDLGFSTELLRPSLDMLIKILESIETKDTVTKVFEPFIENEKHNLPPDIDITHPYKEHEQLWQDFNHKVYLKNNYDLMKRSDMMVAILNGADVDSGVASEIGKFYSLKLGPIIGYRDDFRLGENIASRGINLEVSGSIKESVYNTVIQEESCIVSSLGSLKSTVSEYIFQWQNKDCDD